MSLELLQYFMNTIMLHMQSCYCIWSKLSNRISIHTIIKVLFWCTISALKFAFNWEHIHALSDEFWKYTHILKWLISIVLCVCPILVNCDDEIEEQAWKTIDTLYSQTYGCILNLLTASLSLHTNTSSAFRAIHECPSAVDLFLFSLVVRDFLNSICRGCLLDVRVIKSWFLQHNMMF